MGRYLIRGGYKLWVQDNSADIKSKPFTGVFAFTCFSAAVYRLSWFLARTSFFINTTTIHSLFNLNQK